MPKVYASINEWSNSITCDKRTEIRGKKYMIHLVAIPFDHRPEDT